MIKLTEPVAYAALDLISATLAGMIEDGEYNEAMASFSGPAAEQDRIDHQAYANNLVVAHNDLVMQLKDSHSVFGVRTEKMKLVEHFFTLLP